jgi:hypothetical protein
VGPELRIWIPNSSQSQPGAGPPSAPPQGRSRTPSRISRTRAAASVSPSSTFPPGRLHDLPVSVSWSSSRTRPSSITTPVTRTRTRPTYFTGLGRPRGRLIGAERVILVSRPMLWLMAGSVRAVPGARKLEGPGWRLAVEGPVVRAERLGSYGADDGWSAVLGVRRGLKLPGERRQRPGGSADRGPGRESRATPPTA